MAETMKANEMVTVDKGTQRQPLNEKNVFRSK